MDSLNSNASPSRQLESSQFPSQSSSVRETGSEIFIQSTLPSVTSATIEDAEGVVDEPLGEAMPSEVIITVNVSEWDPEKACALEDNLETGASSVDSPASSDE